MRVRLQNPLDAQGSGCFHALGLQRDQPPRKHLLAHERLLERQVAQSLRFPRVQRIGLGKALGGTLGTVDRRRGRAGEQLRHPGLLHLAADHQKKHKMPNLVVQHVPELLRRGQPVHIDRARLLVKLRQPPIRKAQLERGVTDLRDRRVDDLVQARQMEARQGIQRRHTSPTPTMSCSLKPETTRRRLSAGRL